MKARVETTHMIYISNRPSEQTAHFGIQQKDPKGGLAILLMQSHCDFMWHCPPLWKWSKQDILCVFVCKNCMEKLDCSLLFTDRGMNNADTPKCYWLACGRS